MATSIKLNVSKKSYEDRIAALEGDMNTLRGIYDEYSELNRNVTNFLGNTDDNFQRMQANVMENIKAVIRAYNTAKESRDELRNQVTKLEDLSGHVGDMLDASANTARQGISVLKASDALL